jgi:integrase/recombinase XerD
MPNDLVKASPVSIPAPSLVKLCRCWSSAQAGRHDFARDELFYAEHHNSHTQKAYVRAVRRLLASVKGGGR